MIQLVISKPGNFPKPRDSRLEQAYAPPVLLEEKGADSESIQRYERKSALRRAFRDEDGELGDDGRRRRHRGSRDDEGCLTTDGFINTDLRVGGPYLCMVPIQTSQIPASHPLTVHLDP